MGESGEEVTIDIDACVTYKSTSNSVDIGVTHETEVLLVEECGKFVDIGTGLPHPFPNSHLLLKDIVSFDPHNMYPLLYEKLQDHVLCNRLSVKIASEAEGVPWPLYISLHVTLTPHRVIEFDSLSDEIDDTETCAICLVEERHLFLMPNCRHVFHDYCINAWLSKSNACPLCRAVIDDDYGYA